MKMAEEVNTIFRDCLFDTPPENEDQAVIVHGVLLQVGFNPPKVEEHRDQIAELLDNLPKEFHENVGGGWSFLQACEDCDGNQWTGLHRTMDELVCLGLATGRVRFCLEDREIWKAFPGGLPYFMVTAT